MQCLSTLQDWNDGMVTYFPEYVEDVLGHIFSLKNALILLVLLEIVFTSSVIQDTQKCEKTFSDSEFKKPCR